MKGSVNICNHQIMIFLKLGASQNFISNQINIIWDNPCLIQCTYILVEKD